MEVPIVFTLSNAHILYYANLDAMTAEGRAMWSSLNKEGLPDPLYAPPFPS